MNTMEHKGRQVCELGAAPDHSITQPTIRMHCIGNHYVRAEPRNLLQETMKKKRPPTYRNNLHSASTLVQTAIDGQLVASHVQIAPTDRNTKFCKKLDHE